MPPKVVVLCHVEPGTVRGHTVEYGFDRTEGIVRALPTILEFADRLHISMGLALTPQALRLADVDLNGHEVGLHLHPLDPVLSERLVGRVRPRHDCLARYPQAEQAQLVAASRRIFEERMGRAPRLFVAGRWSEDAATAAVLRGEGFTHDGSAFPGYHSPCADWSRLPRLTQPYSPSADDYQARGSEPCVYLPVYRGLWGHPFTPEVVHDLGVSYFKAALDEARVGNADVVHIYFHSPMALDPRAMAQFEEILRYAREVLRLPFVVTSSLRPSVRSRSRPFPPANWARIDRTLIKSFLGRGELGRKLLDVPEVDPDWDGTGTAADQGPRGSGPS